MGRKYKDQKQKIIDDAMREALINLTKIKEKLGHKCRNGKPLIPSDKLRFIVDNHNKMTRVEISEKLGLNVHQLSHILTKLNLKTVYMDKYEYAFNELYNTLTGYMPNAYTLQYILEKYGCPIYRKNGNRLKMINLLQFYDWYSKHIKIINLCNYKIGSLPQEPDWFLEKADADKRAYEYIYKRKWTEAEDAKLKQMVTDRHTYKEICFALKRTGSAIKRRCYDLKINKPRRVSPRYWRKREISTVKELWLKGYEPCIIAEEISKPTFTDIKKTDFANLPKNERCLNLKQMYCRQGEGRSDREVISVLERYKYFGMQPEKFRG